MAIDVSRSVRVAGTSLIGRAMWLGWRTAGHLAGTTALAIRHGDLRPRSYAALHRTRLPDLLIRLGPSFMKVGQLLSTRRDLLSAETCDALGRLAADVPAPPAATVARTLARVYGPPDVQPFARFAAVPLASGTIASVHHAVLQDGREVAVKVRREGIANVMAADLALLSGFARAAGVLPGLRRVPVAEMTRQVGGAVSRQLDFPAERAALQDLADNFADLAAVRVPRPVTELCSAETVVMEFVPGLAAYRPETLAADQRKDVVVRTLECVYRMLFRDGLVHCDLHPGNLYLQSGTVVMLDAGFVVRLPEHVRRLFAAFFLNMALGRGARCADIVLESAAAVHPDSDLDGFRRELAALVAEVHGQQALDFSLAQFAARLFALQRRYGLYAAAEFVFPLLSLLVIEGMINEFDSSVDFQAVAVPIILQSIYQG